MGLLDDLAKKQTSIHRIHPLIKLLTTGVYLFMIVSFDRYEIGRLIPFFFYPILLIVFAEIPIVPILKRVLLVEPLIIGIGILNPLFDHHTITLGDLEISRGWITFLAIFIKCGLTIVVSLLLVATTGMDKLAASLRMIKVPKIFVLQLLLTYRYVTVLIEEVSRMTRAYSLRSPGTRGIHYTAWGSFAGQLLLRTFDRAQHVYQAMILRGFAGEYHTGSIPKINRKDITYLSVWVLFFIISRMINLPMWIGSVLTGG